MAERKRYTAEEKAAIVLEVIQDGKKISEVAEENMALKKNFSGRISGK